MTVISHIADYFTANISRFSRIGYHLISAMALFYFFARTVYFALNINPNIPPDEAAHYGRIIAFSKVLWIPPDSPETWELGLIAREPPLYYLVFAKLLRLNVFGMPDLIYLRLLNAFAGLGIILISCAWFRMITDNRLTRLLFLIISTNTLMFTFLCGSVSYDNLANLLAVAGVYSLFRFIRHRRAEHLLLAGIFILAGILTKVTLLPIAAVMVTILIIHERADLGRIPRAVHRTFHAPSGPVVVYAVLFVILSGCSIGLYGVNLVKYRKIIPDFDQVLTNEQAMHNRIYARNKIYRMFLKGEMTYDEAIGATSIIKNPTDSICTVVLIRNAQYRKTNATNRIDRISYVPFWMQVCLERMYGIHGFLLMYMTRSELSLYAVFYLLALLIFVRKRRSSDGNGLMDSAVFLSFAYVLILMQFVCYPNYEYFGSPDGELQGRYVFPVLPLLYGTASFYLMSIRSKLVQVALLCAVSYVFIRGDMPFFLSHAYAVWFIH